ncbi:hypothetical protein K0B96_03835 [Horticoccus luteus]|uniref:Uncharacterized protein n=1 Tax=Horticoccus luteus TaxID=2862869 RepID=A0A8F9TXW3_9BACT|nr:hypothetical protein [Horticoccus luteus]QYM79758.1 hypothetical protein K0B96_03835 [Horticoccus luteus]
MNRLLRLTIAAASMLVVTVVAQAELPIIAKARAYLGNEKTIDALTSVHFAGKLNADDSGATGPVQIDIIFQKPDQQRIEAKSNKGTEVTGLNGYEAWHRVQDAKDKAGWQLTLLGKDQVKRLRANTWENLAFFRGIERIGGQLKDEGTAVVDGVTTRKIAFIHDPDIVFYRYFDPATGRLVRTETEAGGSIREEGEVIVDGIRFPQKLITVSKNADGKEITVSITFEKITVNENFPDSLFAVPDLIPN